MRDQVERLAIEKFCEKGAPERLWLGVGQEVRDWYLSWAKGEGGAA